MPDVRAFRGIRYDLAHVGSLREVVAPPYDVIDESLQNQLYEQHPCNVVRLILNRIETGDDDQKNRYSRAGKFMKNWLHQGVLMNESDPAVYVYHQEFEYQETSYVRKGVMARVKLEPFGQGTIYPHEQTFPGPKQDRLDLMNACRSNLSQIFSLVSDPDQAGGQAIDRAIEGLTPLEAACDSGVTHRLWPVTNVAVIQTIQAAYAGQPTFVADGHHRYETACLYRDQLARENGGLDPEHPANFVLMMLVGMDDPGMLVLPTHRIFRGLPDYSAEEFCNRLAPAFECEVIQEPAEYGETMWSQIENDDRQGQIGFFLKKSNCWVKAEINDGGRSQMDEHLSNHTANWRSLGVAILHHLVINKLLDGEDLPRAAYLHDAAEVVQSLKSDQSEPPFSLAALVMPATIENVKDLSLEGERMPQKSTYFFPKLLSGLVFNPLS